MRKRMFGCMGALAAVVALIAWCAPLDAAVGNSAKNVSDGSGQGASKASVQRDVPATIKSLKDGSLRTAQTVSDALPPKLDKQASTAEQGRYVRVPASGVPGNSVTLGLRAPGDNDILLFDNLQGNTWSGDNEVGDDVVVGASVAPPGQAYVIDQISLAVIRHVSTTTPTWARIKFWGTYDLDIAGGPCAVPEPVHTELLSTLIVNLGPDEDTACNTFDRLQINLVTGEVFDLFAGAVLFADGIISHRAPNGADLTSVAAGTGDGGIGNAQVFVSIEFGVPNIGQTDIVDAPTDACDPSPGGRAMYNSTGQDVLAGASNDGFYSDTFGNNDGEWDCDEFVAFGFTPHNGAQFRLRGSLGNDCNTNGIWDGYEVAADLAADVNGNNIPDDCETADCNNNGIVDICDVDCANQTLAGVLCSTAFPGTCGMSSDCNDDGVPDECQLTGNDCNSNGIPDDCDISSGFSDDCQPNNIPDECDVDPNDPDGDGFFWGDCDNNGAVDACERFLSDCNGNGVDDFCDIVNGDANDANANNIPDACDARGMTVILDFEDDGDPDRDYVTVTGNRDAANGSVNEQPVEADAGPDSRFFADWLTFDDSAGTVAKFNDAGFADVFDGSIAGSDCGGTEVLHLTAIASNGVNPDWATDGPHVFFSDPNVETVFASEPLRTEMELDLEFNIGASPIDWDFYFGSTFDQFINSGRCIVSFLTNTDGSAEIVVFAGNTVATGIDWTTNGPTHNLQVILDYTNSTSIDPLTDAGTVIWDGVPIATFTPDVGTGDLLSFDKVFIDHFRNDNVPFVAGNVEVDCIRLTQVSADVPCSEYKGPDGQPGTDCDGNGICDHFELGGLGDLNGNGTLDRCEGYCIDCNHNLVADSFEIAGGTAPDTNMNGIIDWCEGPYPTSFEAAQGFAPGQLGGPGIFDGQEGWSEFGDSLSEVTNVASGAFPTQGTQYITISENPATVTVPLGILFGPRMEAADDADVEYWGIDLNITATDFGNVAFEIADLCLDGPALVGADPLTINVTPFFQDGIGVVANTGLNLRGDPDGAVPIQLQMLELSGGDRLYENTNLPPATAVNDLADGRHSMGIYIANTRGDTFGLWAATQTVLFSRDASLNFNNDQFAATETQGGVQRNVPDALAPGDAGTLVPTGGDAQAWIRTDGDHGDLSTTQFFFDNLTYSTGQDCDNDGIDDAVFLASAFGAGYDQNGDGIPDNCQDCDNDCPPFPISAGNVGCLDPNDGPDCNANGIPDACDINPDRPAEWMYHSACFGDGPEFDALDGLEVGRCFETWAGGGSLDCNNNGVPDECDGVNLDCNGNLVCDGDEIAGGTAADVDGNGVPDECQDDCNNNAVPDTEDISLGLPDGCQDAVNNATGAFPAADGICDECCPYTPNGDMDDDGDFDEADYAAIQQCAGDVAGSYVGVPPQPQCGCADINGDGVVDDCDVQAFILLLTGPQNAPNGR